MTACAPQMQLIEVSAAGGPENLTPGRRLRPVAQSGELLVKVAYAGVNGPDIMQRKGLYPPPQGASHILGLEIAGEVVAAGDNTRRWKVGETVRGLPQPVVNEVLPLAQAAQAHRLMEAARHRGKIVLKV